MANNITGETISQQASTVIDGSEFILVEKLVGDIAKNFGISVNEIRLFIEKEFKDKKVFVNDQAYVHTDENFTTALKQKLEALQPGGGGAGTTDYMQLANKPAIGGVTLEGNKTPEQIGLQPQMDSNTVLATLNGQTVHYGDRVDLPGAGGGSGVVVEAELNPESTNAIQNGTVAKKFGELDRSVLDAKSNVGFISEKGEVNTSDRNFNFFIVKIDKGEDLYIKGADSKNQYLSYLAFFDANLNYIKEGNLSNTGRTEDTILKASYPTKSVYAFISKRVASVLIVKNGKQPVKFYTLDDIEIAKVPAKLSDKVNVNSGKNIFDKSQITKGFFINKQGGVQSNQEYFVSDYISVKKNKHIISSGGSFGGSFACLYDESLTPIPGKIMQSKADFDTDDAAYFRFGATNDLLDKIQIEYGSVATSYEEYNPIRGYIQNKVNKVYGKKITKGTLSLSDPRMDATGLLSIKNGVSYCFQAKLKNASGFTLVVSSGESEIVVTETQIKYGSRREQMVEHTLTLKDFISVIYGQYNNGKAKVELITSTGHFSLELKFRLTVSEEMYAEIEGGECTDCHLSVHSSQLDNDIWAIGDSYFDIWTDVLYGYGYKNWAALARGGATSDWGYRQLEKALAYGKPKILLWCEGMNNWESPWDGHQESYQSWEDNFNKVKVLCEQEGILMIGYLTPSTKTHSNARKNTYVKQSGIRYIDANAAVGDGNGNWFDGALNTDDIHPTRDKGAYLVASAVFSAVPEIAQ